MWAHRRTEEERSGGQEVRSQKDYESLYGDVCARAEALRVALEARRVELDLYWRRSSYFWAFAAAVFAVYFSVLKAGSPPSASRHGYLLLISTVGLLLSWGWFLAARGGKYWTSNWELHVDWLEKAAGRPLFATVVDPKCFRKANLFRAYPHSVGKINQANGLLILFVWGALMLHNFMRVVGCRCWNPSDFFWTIPFVGLCYAWVLWRCTETDPDSRSVGNQWFVARESGGTEEEVSSAGAVGAEKGGRSG